MGKKAFSCGAVADAACLSYLPRCAEDRRWSLPTPAEVSLSKASAAAEKPRGAGDKSTATACGMQSAPETKEVLLLLLVYYLGNWQNLWPLSQLWLSGRTFSE